MPRTSKFSVRECQKTAFSACMLCIRWKNMETIRIRDDFIKLGQALKLVQVLHFSSMIEIISL
jgi:hypothetical protein